jgi:predicted DNA-binding transcriptional regulator AlpA
MSNRTSRLLDTNEAAEFLGTAPSTLTIWRCTKRYPLPYIKVGGAVKYRESDLLEFLESRTVHPVEAEPVEAR